MTCDVGKPGDELQEFQPVTFCGLRLQQLGSSTSFVRVSKILFKSC